MADQANPVWWVELIKVSPGLIAAMLAVGLVVAFRKELRALAGRTTKFKVLGVEAEFASKEMDSAIAAKGIAVGLDDKRSALRRLQFVAPLLRNVRILWIDDRPEGTRDERALLETYGVHVTTLTNSAEAERLLRENVYALVITDLQREGKDTEGLAFVGRTVEAGVNRPTIAYVSTDQANQARPAYLFAITNRPDQLVHYVCDVIERERL